MTLKQQEQGEQSDPDHKRLDFRQCILLHREHVDPEETHTAQRIKLRCKAQVQADLTIKS